MSDIRWTGEAEAVAQVDTFTPASVEVGDVFTLTITWWDGTSTSVSFTATAATVANVTAGLTAAWNDSTHALCTAITAEDNETDMTLTADTAGVPFSVAASTTDGGGTDDQTLSRAATTASAGPSHWDSVDNWDGGAVPDGAHNVYIDNASDDIIYGLDQSSITTLTSLNIGKSFTGKIGYNGASGYSGTYLQIKATTVNIGDHSGTGSPAGSGRIMLDTGSTTSTININDSASTGTDSNKPPIRILANDGSTVLNIRKGIVGVAYESGETSTLSAINISYNTNKTSDAKVYIKSGVTLTTLDKIGGECELSCAATTVTNEAGTLKILGGGAITTLNNYGTVYSNSTGTITTFNQFGGVADCTTSRLSRTITTLKLDQNSVFKYDPSIVTLTNKIQPYDTTGNITVSMN